MSNNKVIQDMLPIVNEKDQEIERLEDEVFDEEKVIECLEEIYGPEIKRI